MKDPLAMERPLEFAFEYNTFRAIGAHTAHRPLQNAAKTTDKLLARLKPNPNKDWF